MKTPKIVEVTIITRGRDERFKVPVTNLKRFLAEKSRQGNTIRVRFPNGTIRELLPVHGVIRVHAINQVCREAKEWAERSP